MPKKERFKTEFIEAAVARYLSPRVNLIVPNAYWGLGFSHELDMLVITPSNCAWEIEIKVDKYDLRNDKLKQKWKNYYNGRIRRLYYAIPDYLVDEIEHVQEKAGILIVDKHKRVSKKREATNISNHKFSDNDRMKALHMCCMRYWNLKLNLT